MAPVEFICPMCGIRNGNYKIYDDFGNVLIDTKAQQEQREAINAKFSQLAKEMEREKNQQTQKIKETKNMMQKWEYKVINGYEGLPNYADFEQKNRQMETVLNKYGALGWEVVQEHNYTVILKRPKQF